MAGHLGHVDAVPACESERSRRSVFSFHLYMRPETGSWILGRSPQGSPAQKSVEAIESFNEINNIQSSHPHRVSIESARVAASIGSVAPRSSDSAVSN